MACFSVSFEMGDGVVGVNVGTGTSTVAGASAGAFDAGGGLAGFSGESLAFFAALAAGGLTRSTAHPRLFLRTHLTKPSSFR